MPVQHDIAAPTETGARHLISEQQFTAVRRTVMGSNPQMSEDVAGRIVAEALAFVAACTGPDGRGLRPSRTVDEGWHALILHTKVYADLCAMLGKFVHHVPEPADPGRHNAEELDRTQAAISATGYVPDPLLWLPPTDTTIPVGAECEHSEPPPDGCGADCSNTGPN